jgi:hypothetical protein
VTHSRVYSYSFKKHRSERLLKMLHIRLL